MSLPSILLPVGGFCFPRVSGDEPRSGSNPERNRWFSPRERG